jgi:phospholipid transport system substrate-binding protein
MDRHQAHPFSRIRPISRAIAVFSGSIVCCSLIASAQTVAGITAPVTQPRPLEVVKASFARVLAVQPGERRAEIRRVTPQLFDFHEMGRLMLGEHWQAASPKEQDEFVRLFAQMLDRVYLVNVGSMPLASVTFEGEQVSGSFARVTSRMPSRRGDTAIEYRLMNRGGHWTVYDIVVDGVGLVSSYRSQFNSVLRTASFAELLDRLRVHEASIKAEQGR